MENEVRTEFPYDSFHTPKELRALYGNVESTEVRVNWRDWECVRTLLELAAVGHTGMCSLPQRSLYRDFIRRLQYVEDHKGEGFPNASNGWEGFVKSDANDRVSNWFFLVLSNYCYRDAEGLDRYGEEWDHCNEVWEDAM